VSGEFIRRSLDSERYDRAVAKLPGLDYFDLYPRYATDQAKGPNMLNYRRFPLAKIGPGAVSSGPATAAANSGRNVQLATIG